MFLEFGLLLLPVAAASGWFASHKHHRRQNHLQQKKDFSKEYVVGLNYLLNEQPDKAVDIFVKALETDSSVVETHLALGNLFRKQGEVDRAIRIHQNLIARPQLNREQNAQALFALGQDYMAAGVLDRAERIFLELQAHRNYFEASIKFLLEIYQQEKNWDAAIKAAKKIYSKKEKSSEIISHFYCELCVQSIKNGQWLEAQEYLKHALSHGEKIRTGLLSAEILMEQKQYPSAIKTLTSIIPHDPSFLPEIISPLISSYQKLGQPESLNAELKQLYQTYPRSALLRAIAEQIRQYEGIDGAIQFLEESLHRHYSLIGFSLLMELEATHKTHSSEEKLNLWAELCKKIAMQKEFTYLCTHCGFSENVLDWQCPGCKRWGTIKPMDGILNF